MALAITANVVGDGVPKVGSPFHLQLVLLPFTAFFCFVSWLFLFSDSARALNLCGHTSLRGRAPRSVGIVLWTVYLFELSLVALFIYETVHFAGLGYRLLPVPTTLIFSTAIVVVGYVCAFREFLRPLLRLLAFCGAYAAGHILAIVSFPLNYLRSDMLPVIFWSSRALLSGQNPYQHFYVADRIYDFPYLPGMLLVFVPALALHLDLRWAAIVYNLAGMCLIYRATKDRFRGPVTALIGLFLLCPYLQYRHELYTQGHFFSLILIFFLMQRRRFVWSAIAFGLSMTISQFSWVIFPFFLLNALRRGGWKELARMLVVGAITMLVILGPFYASGVGQIAHNAVGQWDNLQRPIARPMNLAFWASYAVRPAQLKWIQLTLLAGMFAYCFLKRRCDDLADTLRWMIAALIVFILFNVLVDGYFYLMLLVPMLVYTCVVSGWWEQSSERPLLPTSSAT